MKIRVELDEEHIEKLEKLAKHYNMSRSQIITLLIHDQEMAVHCRSRALPNLRIPGWTNAEKALQKRLNYGAP